MHQPGWKTSEFWLTAAVGALGAAVAAGLLPATLATVAGLAVAGLTAAMYGHGRAGVKAEASRVGAIQNAIMPIIGQLARRDVVHGVDDEITADIKPPAPPK